jgi:hypothetical protein
MTDLRDLDRLFPRLRLVVSGPLERLQFQEQLSLSRASLYLSKYEGFGLLPFESVLNSCLPVALDCGGVTSYLPDNYVFLLNKNSSPETVCESVVESVLSCDDFRLATFRYLIESLFKYARLAKSDTSQFTVNFSNALISSDF